MSVRRELRLKIVPKGQPFAQPRATPWGSSTTSKCSVGPTDQSFAANRGDIWPVGPVLRAIARVPRAMPMGWVNRGPSAHDPA
jgi:hypothetical protein